MTPVIDPERVPEHLLHEDVKTTLSSLRRRIATLQRRLEDKQRESIELQRRLLGEQREARRLRTLAGPGPGTPDRTHRVRTMLRARAAKSQ